VPVAADVDGGNGAHIKIKRIAELGAEVVLVDLTDQHDKVADFNAAVGRQAFRFYPTTSE
jgi:hypothetical protein